MSDILLFIILIELCAILLLVRSTRKYRKLSKEIDLDEKELEKDLKNIRDEMKDVLKVLEND